MRKLFYGDQIAAAEIYESTQVRFISTKYAPKRLVPSAFIHHLSWNVMERGMQKYNKLVLFNKS